MHHATTIKLIAVLVAACSLLACKKPVSESELKIQADQQQEKLKALAEQQRDDKIKAVCINTALARLKDPDSAKITEMVKTGPINVDLPNGTRLHRITYSFNLNAKNSFGGYVGKRPYNCLFNVDPDELEGLFEMP